MTLRADRRALLRCRARAVMLAALVGLAGCSPGSIGSPEDPAAGSADPGAVGDVRRVPGQVVDAGSAALSPGGETLAAGCLDDLCLWETDDGALRATYDGGNLVAWSPDGELLATDGFADGSTRATVRLLAAGDGREVRTLDGHPVKAPSDELGAALAALAFGPAGEVVASAGPDGTVRLWSVEDGEELAVLETGSETPDGLAFSPDGARLAVAAPDAPVEVWDVATGELVGTLDAEPQQVVAFGPEGRLLATATSAPGADATVHLWDAGSLAHRQAFPGPVSAQGLAFSPDGSTLAIAQEDQAEVLLWPVDGGEVRRLDGHDEAPRSVLWSPAGETVYSLSGEEGALAWDAGTGELRQRFELPTG